jgi:hypothetical protein
MQIYKHSITFDEITYDVQELRDWYKPFAHLKGELSTAYTGGVGPICDVAALEGKQVHEYPLIQKLASYFKPLEQEAKLSNFYARIFTSPPGGGLGPHIDEGESAMGGTHCAIIFPIVPDDISPVIYMKEDPNRNALGSYWEWSDFTLDDIDYVHQYKIGHPSLIDARYIHTGRNFSTQDRAILRFKISHMTYAECYELCKNGEFLNYDLINQQ